MLEQRGDVMLEVVSRNVVHVGKFKRPHAPPFASSQPVEEGADQQPDDDQEREEAGYLHRQGAYEDNQDPAAERHSFLRVPLPPPRHVR